MRKPIVLIDFDKTITPIHGFSEPPVAEAVACINRLKDYFKIVIFSCRANVEICNEAELIEMCDYLRKYEIHYDDILFDKPLFAGLIDDRTFNPNHISWKEIGDSLIASLPAKIVEEPEATVCFKGSI